MIVNEVLIFDKLGVVVNLPGGSSIWISGGMVRFINGLVGCTTFSKHEFQSLITHFWKDTAGASLHDLGEWAEYHISRKFHILDSFRHFDRDGGNYTWWSYMHNARAKNIGWRIDYFCTSAALKGNLKDAFIRAQVHGSDHCPVGLILK